MEKQYIVCARENGKTIYIGIPFLKRDLDYIKERIQVPVVAANKVFQPDEMWIEEYEQNKNHHKTQG